MDIPHPWELGKPLVSKHLPDMGAEARAHARTRELRQPCSWALEEPGALGGDLGVQGGGGWSHCPWSCRELTLQKGDIVYIHKEVDRNWLEGEHHGRLGIFPSNYVEVSRVGGHRCADQGPGGAKRSRQASCFPNTMPVCLGHQCHKVHANRPAQLSPARGWPSE